MTKKWLLETQRCLSKSHCCWWKWWWHQWQYKEKKHWAEFQWQMCFQYPPHEARLSFQCPKTFSPRNSADDNSFHRRHQVSKKMFLRLKFLKKAAVCQNKTPGKKSLMDCTGMGEGVPRCQPPAGRVNKRNWRSALEQGVPGLQDWSGAQQESRGHEAPPAMIKHGRRRERAR